MVGPITEFDNSPFLSPGWHGLRMQALKPSPRSRIASMTVVGRVDPNDGNPHVCIQLWDKNNAPFSSGKSISFHRDDVPGLIKMLRMLEAGPLGRLAIEEES